MDDQSPVVSEERIRNAITLARNLRNNGASRDSIAARLASRGFDKRSIDAVLREVPAEAADNIIVKPDPAPGGRLVLVLAGLFISGLGVFFFIGNRTGLAPSVPFFGFALMVVGGVLMAAGRS